MVVPVATSFNLLDFLSKKYLMEVMQEWRKQKK